MDDYPHPQALLTTRRGSLRCNVHLHGAPGGRTGQPPDFSPALASSLLENRILWRGSVYVPSPLDDFASLAFHALYHEFGEIAPAGRPEDVLPHDQAAELARAAADAAIGPIAITPDGLHSWLMENGFAPPPGMLSRFAWRRPELIRFAGLPDFEEVRLKGELILFVISVGGASARLRDSFLDMLESSALRCLRPMP